jgi:phage tail sheath gpL-like
VTRQNIVSLSEIPYDWVKPGVFLEVRPNYVNMGRIPWPAKTLLHGPIGAAGTAAAGVIRALTRPEEADAWFGRGTVTAAMARLYLTHDRGTPLYALGCTEDPAWVAAAATVNFSGAGRGTVPLYIAGRRVDVVVNAAMTPTAMAAAAAAAVNLRDDLPVTAAASGPAVTLTAKNRGAIGNNIDVRVGYFADESAPAGVAVAAAAMSGGVGEPNVQTQFLDPVPDDAWYTDLVSPYTAQASLAAYEAHLALAYQAMGRRDCHLWTARAGTYGQLMTFADTVNSPFVTALGVNRCPMPVWEVAAALAAGALPRLNDDPARQLRSLDIPDVLPPVAADRFIETEQNFLLKAGIATFEAVGDDRIVMDRIVTTYKRTALAIPDRAWLDVMVPKTMSHIRYDWRMYVSLLYPRHKLTADESFAARSNTGSVVTPGRMKGSWAARCKLYEEYAWIEDVERTVKESLFAVDPSDRNRMQGRQQVSIIGNLMQLVGALEFQV